MQITFHNDCLLIRNLRYPFEIPECLPFSKLLYFLCLSIPLMTSPSVNQPSHPHNSTPSSIWTPHVTVLAFPTSCLTLMNTWPPHYPGGWSRYVEWRGGGVWASIDPGRVCSARTEHVPGKQLWFQPQKFLVLPASWKKICRSSHWKMPSLLVP